MRLLPESAMPDMLREGRPGPYFMSDPARVRAILGDAGWKDVSLEPVEMPLHVGGAATLDEAVEYSLQIGSAARAMDGAPEALKPALEAAIRDALAPFASARGVFMDGAAFVVRARLTSPTSRSGQPGPGRHAAGHTGRIIGFDGPVGDIGVAPSRSVRGSRSGCEIGPRIFREVD